MESMNRQVKMRLMKGLLDMIVLEILQGEATHGYQIISRIRKTFGVYFGASTIYPLLTALEQKGYVKSAWNMSAARPRKVYTLTPEGERLLNYTEDTVTLVCRKMGNTQVEMVHDAK